MIVYMGKENFVQAGLQFTANLGFVASFVQLLLPMAELARHY